MSDLIKKTIREVLEQIADVDSEAPAYPIAADDAYQAIDRELEFQLYVLSQIAKNKDIEPWAANVASDWLDENGY